jgi:pyruvate,orthophosphate dikinase
LNEADLREVKSEFQKIIEAETKKPFPMDPREQLRQAVTAVFDSWFGKRAQDYRKFHGIPNDSARP